MNAQLKLESWAQTDRGRVREKNEDDWGSPEKMGIAQAKVEQKGHLYVVADGMGGYAGGERASHLAVSQVLYKYYSDPSPDARQSLRRAIELANMEIYQEAASNPALQEMGTTLVAAVFRGSELLIANMGDSRAYLIRGKGIEQITRDHTWVAESLRAHTLSEEEAIVHPRRNVVTRSLGNRPDVEIDFFTVQVQKGDVILLCSDGLSNMVDDLEIRDTVCYSKSPREATSQLINLANQRGGFDNITVITLNLDGVSGVTLGSLATQRLLSTWLPIVGGLAAMILVMLVILINLQRARYQNVAIAPTATSTPPLTPLVLSPTAANTHTPRLMPAPIDTGTLTPTFTSTFTPELPPPAFTPTSAPESPTPTATMTPAAMEIAPTLTPTSAPELLTPTVTTEPTLMPTVTVTSTLTVTVPTSSGPVLLEPEEDRRTTRDSITLKWEWGGELGENEHFDVQIRPKGVADSVFTDWTKESTYELKKWSTWQPGEYTWTIAIIRGHYDSNGEKVLEKDLGLASEARLFRWDLGSGGEEEDGGSESPWKP